MKLWRNRGAMVLCAMLLVLLTGCIFRSPDELYRPPQHSPGYEKLTAKIDEIKRQLEIEYGAVAEPAVIYAGNNTAPIQLQDLDEDGEPETAVIFLRIPGAEMPLRIYFMTLQSDDSYQVSSVVEGDGSAIYAVDYVDFNGGGKKELVVSWQTSTNVYQLGVYALENTDNLHDEQLPGSAVRVEWPEATELMRTTYSGYSLLDIDQDTRTELAVIRVDSAGTNSLAEVYSWRGDAFVSQGRTRLSTGITTLSRVQSNFVAGSARALYITSTLIDGSQATDIVVWRNNELVNLTLNPETGVSDETIRGYFGGVGPSDVNDDTVLELPRPHMIPSYSEGVSSDFWLLDWSQYDISGRAVPVFTTYHNTMDGWYFEIPARWVDKITIARDDSVSGERAVVFYHWNGDKKEPTPFLAIYKMTGTNRTVRATRENRFILSEDESTIYAASFLGRKWDCGLEEMDVMDHFHRILSGWPVEG